MAILYQDKLVELTDEAIVFHEYYFPFGTDKRLPWAEIERIEVRTPSFWTGSWRFWGTGDFRTWFPKDYGRASRDRIFLAVLRGKFRRIGFTVENSARVTELLAGRGLLREPPPA